VGLANYYRVDKLFITKISNKVPLIMSGFDTKFYENRSISTILGIKKANGKNPVGVGVMAAFEPADAGV
jgi:hypothetical protein